MTCTKTENACKDLHLYEIELTRGNEIRVMELWCTSGTQATFQALGLNVGFDVTGCREVQR